MKLLRFLLLGIQLFAVVFSIDHIWGNNGSNAIEWVLWLVAGIINASGLIIELRKSKD